MTEEWWESTDMLLLWIAVWCVATWTRVHSQQEQCECVPYYLCKEGRIITDGENLLDIRARSCPGVEVCCALDNGETTTSLISPETTTSLISPDDIGGVDLPRVDNTKSEPGSSLEVPAVSGKSGCGRRRLPPGLDTGLRITGPRGIPETTFYGEAPWMVTILKKETQLLFKCGGSLITPSTVLTAAHCVNDFTTEEIVVRAGEYDARVPEKPLPSQVQNVKEIRIHPDYNSANLFNDIAILILKGPMTINPVVDNICAPRPNEAVIKNACFVTGWGRNASDSNGFYQNVLSKVSLELRDRNYCQNLLRTSRLGSRFRLNDGFVCAGGGSAKDTCTGDGGGPLVCPTESNPNRLVQMGIVAWGVGCGEGFPTVLTSVPYYLTWIQKQLS